MILNAFVTFAVAQMCRSTLYLSG